MCQRDSPCRRSMFESHTQSVCPATQLTLTEGSTQLGPRSSSLVRRRLKAPSAYAQGLKWDCTRGGKCCFNVAVPGSSWVCGRSQTQLGEVLRGVSAKLNRWHGFVSFIHGKGYNLPSPLVLLNHSNFFLSHFFSLTLLLCFPSLESITHLPSPLS